MIKNWRCNKLGEIITLSQTAADHVKDMMKHNEEEGAFLRVSINGGGCSGLSYGMGFDHDKKDGDHEDEQFGIAILVDHESAPLLKGTKIDYKNSLMGGGFTIENPNALVTCGCGSSFKTATNTGTPESC